MSFKGIVFTYQVYIRTIGMNWWHFENTPCSFHHSTCNEPIRGKS